MFIAANAVDPAKFEPLTHKNRELEQSLELQDKQVIAFLGSFFKYEGLEFALKSLPLIQKEIANIHLLLVGCGNETDNLKALSKELDIEEGVTFTGRVNFEHINDYYSLADALVFPRESIRLTELVTPLKPLESMALGKPVVASDIGGHRELIEHGKTGMLFTAENTEELAKQVIALLNNADLSAKLCNEGLSYINEVRNWKNTANCYVSEYEALVAT